MHKEQNTLQEKVSQVLATIRPQLLMDGGDVELVNVNEDAGVVSVRLTGACGSCPMSTLTLKMGIERTLRTQIPEIQSVEAV